MNHVDHVAGLQDLIPEGLLLLGALLCGGLAVSRRAQPLVCQAVAAAALLAASLAALMFLRGLPETAGNPGYVAFGDGLVVDRFAIFAIPVLCTLTLFIVLLGTGARQGLRTHSGEYHALLLLATLAAALLVSAREMIALWVGLELLAVCVTVLIGLAKTRRRSSEAAFKHLISAMVASAVLLYGLAFLYGLTGTTDLIEVSHGLRHPSAASALALTMVIGALAVKLGVLPAQQWFADAIEGAPVQVAAFVATVGSGAGLALLARVAVTTFNVSPRTWTGLVAILAAAAMLYGNILALAQTTMRRLLAYVLIGQSGFMLMGLLGYAASQQGIAALLFAVATNGVTLLGIFGVVVALENAGVSDSLDQYRGLSRRSPALGITLSLAVVSLLGVPPLVGFFAKVFLLQTAVVAGYAWLVLIALLALVIGASSGLRVLRLVLVDAPDEHAPPLPQLLPPLRAVVVVCGVSVLVMAAAVQPLFSLAAGGAGAITVR